MSASVLAQLTLGYRYLWNRQRRPAALELFIGAGPDATRIDARHLVSTLTELWPARAPRLLLSIRSRPLLHDMLVHGLPDGAWIVVPQDVLAEPALRQRALQARARGLPMVWQGGPGQQPDAELAPPFQLGMYSFDEAQAVRALHALRARLHAPGTDTPDSPLPPGQILQAPPSRVLAGWALDHQGAWAVAGWPMDEMLAHLQHQPPGPDSETITRLLHAIDTDASLDQLEKLFHAEPVLAYRFVAHLNSPALRLRGQIDSLQRGLMLWGLKNVQAWLQAQLSQASDDADLRPVRTQLVTRALLLEHLMDPGDEEDLRRELYLCGLLSQIDQLLGEPMAEALARLPLSQRILQALLEHDGPYYPALQLALALESPDTRASQQLCENYDYVLEDVNRALLRTLAGLPA